MQETINQGMYDRVPLQDDPEGSITAEFVKHIEGLGGVEATEMWTKGTGHYSKQILAEGNIIIPVLIVR